MTRIADCARILNLFECFSEIAFGLMDSPGQAASRHHHDSTNRHHLPILPDH